MKQDRARKRFRMNIDPLGLTEIKVIGGGDRYITINCEQWNKQPAKLVLAFREGARGTTLLGWYSGKKVRELEKDDFGHPEYGDAYKLRRKNLRSPQSFFDKLNP